MNDRVIRKSKCLSQYTHTHTHVHVHSHTYKYMCSHMQTYEIRRDGDEEEQDARERSGAHPDDPRAERRRAYPVDDGQQERHHQTVASTVGVRQVVLDLFLHKH